VYIVDEVHMLTAAAFNAFLKTLEEPPGYAIFILATTEKHKILPTILSRCQIFDFKRITNNDTVEHLQEIADKEHFDADKASLQVIAQKSEGCMRDALSILDKIVSFSNGHVNYHDTLEHLNILDEDYFFKLLEALLNQELANALLLYDQINRKGFEGDTVLNGFAECLRNLMVCKDARAAALLDVVEGMQGRYAETAANINLSYLVSALNILSEAEIGFRMARNKRLHVELCLIKLCYLPQALELAADTEGQLVKKRSVEGPVAYRTRKIPTPVARKTTAPPDEASLNIASEPAPARQPVPPTPPMQNGAPVGAPPAGAQPTYTAPIRTQTPPPPTPAPTPQQQAVPAASGGGQKKSLLQKLHEKHSSGNAQQEAQALPLEMEKLKAAWQEFTEARKAEGLHHIVTSFNLAELHLLNETTAEVVVPSVLSLKLIEQYKTDLLQFVQQSFNNRLLQLQYRAEIVQNDDGVNDLKHLNSQQRFQLMAEQYPLLRELKEKLRLEIGY
jgi:DNA polymerase III subunit gamma/tau